jgi:3-deoxy-D-manno-octulosonic acid kinase
MNATIKRSTQQARRYSLVYDSYAVDDVSVEIFDPDHWGQAAKRHDEGRGSVWFITDVDRHWVLKHYLRGGLFKDLLTDRYLFTGFDRSRMIREFDMLCEMKRRSLPVPRPIAAMAVRSGPLFYRGAMITERLQNSTSLASLISCEEVSDQMWFDVGSTIVLHRDLNVTNILRRGGDWYLIDFDKCCFVGGGATTRWRQDNLSRFQRSIRKLSKETNHSLDQKQWRVFKEGYESALAASQTDSGSVV